MQSLIDGLCEIFFIFKYKYLHIYIISVRFLTHIKMLERKIDFIYFSYTQNLCLLKGVAAYCIWIMYRRSETILNAKIGTLNYLITF